MSLSLLDTNIISYFLKSRSPQLIAKIEAMAPSDLCVSAVTEGELLYGLERIGFPPRLTAAINGLLRTIPVLPWGGETAAAYARLKCSSQPQGITLAPLDLMIASHALAEGATLVTNDTAMKRLAPWIPVQDWTQ